MKKPLLIFSLLLITITKSFAKEIDFSSEFVRAERDYIHGSYKTALKKSETLLKKAESLYGNNHLMKVRVLALTARIYEAQGKYEEYRKTLDQGIAFLQQSPKEDKTLFAIALSDIGYSYYQYGELEKAQQYLDSAMNIVLERKMNNATMENEIRLRQALVYFKQGYLIKAENMADRLTVYAKDLLVKKEAYTDDRGVTRLRKLSKTEIELRKRIAGEAMNLYSLIALENGKYPKAEEIIVGNTGSIKKALGKKDIHFVENIFQNGLLLEEYNSKGESTRMIDKACKKIKKTKLKGINKEVFRMYEKKIMSHRLAGKNKKERKAKRKLERKVVKNYGRQSLWYGKILLLEAEVYILQAEYDRAEEKVREALEGNYFPQYHLERVKGLKILYEVSVKADKYAQATDALNKITVIRQKLNGLDTPAYHMSMLDLASCAVSYSNELNKPAAFYNTSFPVIEKEIDHKHKSYLGYSYAYASLLQYKDQFEKAEEQADKIVNDARKNYGDFHPQYARSLAEAADIYIDLGKYNEAEKNLSAAVDIFSKEGTSRDNENYSESLKTYARLFIIQGQYENAHKLLKKAGNKQGNADLSRVSELVEEEAVLDMEIGKYREAEKSLKEAIMLKEEKYGALHRILVNPLNELSQLYLITGNYTESEKLAKRAANISLTVFGDSSTRLAESLKILGNVYSAIGDYEKAEEAAAKALSIQRSRYGKTHIQIAKTLNDIALIKFYNNAPSKEVENILQEATTIIKNTLGENHPAYAGILYNLGLLYLEIENLNQSSSSLDKANNIWTAKLGENNVHSAEVIFMKGNLSYKKGNYTEAKTNYLSSKNIYEKIFRNAIHPGYLAALSKAGQMDYINGNFNDAVKSLNETTTTYLTYIKKYFPSLSERQKTKYWNKIQKDFEFYNTLAVKLQNENPEMIANAYKYALATKALMLNSSLKVRQRIMESKDSVLVNMFEEWIAQKEFLSSVISMSEEQIAEEGIDVKKLEAEIENLEKDLSDRSEIFAKNLRKKENYQWTDVKKALKENEAAIEIVRFRWYNKKFTDTIIYMAMIVTPESKSNPDMVILNNGKDMEEKWFKYYRNCMRFNIEDKYSYARFWKAIKEKIKDNTTIYFSADGVYNRINPETLPAGKEMYVIDQNEIVLVSNTRDLISRNSDLTALASTASNKIALFGNPLYYSDDNPDTDTTAADSLITRGGGKNKKKKIDQLPGAEQEIKELKKILDKNGWYSEAYLNEDATEKKIKALHDIKVLHIATHGYFIEDHANIYGTEGLNAGRATQSPLLKSGLVLKDGGHLIEKENAFEFNSTDGILTAYEVMNLNFDHCDLIVLSACETGLGEVHLGEGVFGLQRAFLVAGAKTVVMSLFKVDDHITQELMNTFYQNWIKTGDKRKAFVEAKKSIKAKYKNPIYWGAFIMIGVN
ncbi:MAG: CHAT domain-containing protein [Cytophagaceae bacterium]|nr:CHAT domain-containing protein [Cytophagaceae bacterium]